MIARDSVPDYARGYLRVPLAVWADLYCRTPLTRRQLQLVSVVIRESWGWQKRGGEVYRWTRPLTPRQFSQATGLSTDHLARDLKALLHRGVLRESEGRYQVMPEPGLWKSRAGRPPKRRSPAPQFPVPGAETALLSPGLKTANKRQRNVPALPGKQLSPAGDNSRSTGLLSAASEGGSDNASLAEHFLPVITAFAGALSDAERDQLRLWVEQAGVRAVWQSLAEAFRQGPTAVREHLRHQLTMRDRAIEPPGQEPSDA